MEVTESRRTKPRERDPGDLLHLNYLPESCRKEAESGVQGGPQAYSWKEAGRGAGGFVCTWGSGGRRGAGASSRGGRFSPGPCPNVPPCQSTLEKGPEGQSPQGPWETHSAPEHGGRTAPEPRVVQRNVSESVTSTDRNRRARDRDAGPRGLRRRGPWGSARPPTDRYMGRPRPPSPLS